MTSSQKCPNLRHHTYLTTRLFIKVNTHVIHKLSDSHTDQLVALFRNEFWCNTRTRDDVGKMLAHSAITIGLIDSDDNLIGFVRALTDYVYKVMIYDLIVDPDWRGKQLGNLLMDKIINHPELKDIPHFDLYCLPDMIEFYQQYGFTAEPAGLLVMRRDISGQ